MVTEVSERSPQADGGQGVVGVEQTLLVLGASGDLTGRLLLPGLGGLLTNGKAPGLSLVGSGMDDWDDERWRRRVVESFSKIEDGSGRAATVAQGARYLRADVTREEDLRRLLDACAGPVIMYFALPPAITAKACRALAGISLPEGTRLVLEKPFGTDAASARALNQQLARLVPEDRIHRVDHFLGKSTVLNILGLRFANRLLEPVLNAEHVASVDIVFDESLALEGRAGYYDGAGALMDMIQSHLLQVLALMAMEAPPVVNAREIRDRKAEVLRATRVWDDDPVAFSRRARYTAGEIDGRRAARVRRRDRRRTRPQDRDAGRDGARRWTPGGGPGCRSGCARARHWPTPAKRPSSRSSTPQRIPDGLTGPDLPDRLRIGFGPDRLRIDMNINGPADPLELDQVTLEADFGPGDLPPYGEVLRAVLKDDPTLSVRGDTAEECWRIVEPVLAAWRRDEVPLLEYAAGSSGLPESLLTTEPVSRRDDPRT